MIHTKHIPQTNYSYMFSRQDVCTAQYTTYKHAPVLKDTLLEVTLQLAFH